MRSCIQGKANILFKDLNISVRGRSHISLCLIGDRGKKFCQHSVSKGRGLRKLDSNTVSFVLPKENSQSNILQGRNNFKVEYSF